MHNLAMRKVVLFALIVMVHLFALPHMALASKVALVVGNSDYKFATNLDNPKNDALIIANVLREIGFDVLSGNDLTRDGFESLLAQFAEKARGASIAVVYYAGHGIQVKGKTYLIPVDVSLKKERDVRKLLLAEYVLKDAALAKKLAVVIFDACRENPFVRQLAESSEKTRSLGLSRGLARIEQVPKNTLIAYSTRAGTIAYDGGGKNSPYALALQKHLKKGGRDIRMVFGSVRDTVLSLTDQEQEPFTYGSLGGDELVLFQQDGAAKKRNEVSHTLKPVYFSQVNKVRAEKTVVLDEEFVTWQQAIKTNDWGGIERLKVSSTGGVWGYVTERLLLDRQERDQVNLVIKRLKGDELDLDRLNTNLMRDIQKRLAQVNYYSGPLTGRYENITRNSFMQFARDYVAPRARTFEVLVALLELSETIDSAEHLSGDWRGTYKYQRALKGVTEVDFDMMLVFSQGRVSGYVIEPNTFADKRSKNLYADIRGSVEGNKVRWVKTYDGTGGASHSVNYEGTLDRVRKKIIGRWWTSATWSGPFTLEIK